MKLGPTHWVRHAWLALAGALVVLGCTEDYTFVPDESADAAPPDGGDVVPPSTPTACTADEDCAELPNTTLCDANAGYCVECDPAREPALDRCGTGTYCATGGHCVLGCHQDADCLGLSCDPARGLCVNCESDSNCAPGTSCTDAVCTPGCSADDGCPGGWVCCDSVCKNPETDVAACGSCSVTCDQGGACWNGVCGEGPCEPGTAECDGDASNGCETATQNDPQNCGKCHLTCASDFCSGGRCTMVNCASGTADCNGDENDQCETDLTTVTDCTMCDSKCSDVHGTPGCGEGGCSIQCDDGYDDCDKKVGTGCEIDLQSDKKHCGDCDTECKNDNGTTECKDGECVPRCAEGYADCNGDPSDGCEIDTHEDLKNCGGCGKLCAPDNAGASCKDGVCKAACDPGFADCDGNKVNGCEANLSSPETCGDCNNACSANGGKATCNPDHTCSIKCSAGRADCVNGIADGCETDLTASANNCGACGTQCTSSVGTPACSDSKCGVSTCTAPLETCPGAGKCETNLATDAQNCGDCGHSCAFPSASGKCVNKACQLDKCDDGHKDCNSVATDGCEAALGTKENCRSCGETCTNDHGDNSCTTSGCSPTCASGWGDCDGNKNNGCETPLNTLSNCAGCGVPCTKGHATATCGTGSCQIASCNTGWDDCSSNEGTAKDGCETQLNSTTNCGGCGVPCSPAHATASCGTGQCLVTGCSGGYADCTSQAGCETQLYTNSDCAACGDTCQQTHATNTCDPTAHVCKPTCSGGYKSCDGNASNGCETQVNTATNCGDCGVACTNPANATATCSTGSCVVSCDSTHLDCTSAAGCETQKGTTQNCRTCGESCSNGHGSIGCNTSTGCTYGCDAGWDNCDTNAQNGCETSLTTLASCGSCTAKCDIPNSSESCSTGTCVATTCSAGFDDCDNNGTCETQLNSVANCGSCGHTCTPQNGTTSCAGSPVVCTPSCSLGFKSCDNNPDNGCERSITTLNDCGNCNAACAFPNAGASCNVSGSTISCVMGSCTAGFADCSSSAGCETTLGTPTNCATCGNACTNAHGSNTCTGSLGTFHCQPTCVGLFGNCDTDASNGCESPLDSLTNCGGCNSPCAIANGVPSCSGGTCQLSSCNSGYTQCNGENACTQLGTDTNCSACNKACTNQNSSSNHCVSGVCSPQCNGGYKSCDGSPDNGCETAVNTLTNCGNCGTPCTRTNATADCSTQTCKIGTCNASFGDCDLTDSNGCETALGTDTNCASCGDACSNSHGTNKCGTSSPHACVPVCSGAWGDCDSNVTNGCETSLASATSCGACGKVCAAATPYCVVTGDANSPASYHCQAQITLVASYQSAQTTSASLTLNYTPATGTNRGILLAIAAESRGIGVGIAGSRPDSVKYGSTVITSSSAEMAGTVDYWGPDHFIYFVPESVIAAASGAQNIVIETSTTAPSDQMIIANLLQLNGVRQTSPFTPFGGGALGSSSTPEAPDPSVISPTLALATSGSRIYSFASAFWSDGKTCPLNTPTSGCPTWSVSPSTGLTLTETMSTTQLNIGDAVMRAFGMYISANDASTPAPGNYVPSWSIPYSGRMTHLAVVISPAVQP